MGDVALEKGLESRVRLLGWDRHGAGACEISGAIFLNHGYHWYMMRVEDKGNAGTKIGTP